jgi:DNA-directed RNA polymerase subunit RPC12/RpoP
MTQEVDKRRRKCLRCNRLFTIFTGVGGSRWFCPVCRHRRVHTAHLDLPPTKHRGRHVERK